MLNSLIEVSENLARNLCKNLKSKLKQSNGFILKIFLNIHFLSDTLHYVFGVYFPLQSCLKYWMFA